ncbi:MAG: vitamin B12-dependent ribonucleotide reductase [Actinomycetota bacterium]|nr:vitamin B12-dependent ribonucleotide reductase [Actinomycetota bacterium]
MPNISKNAIKVLERRYLARDADGNVTETPLDMFKRVAEAIAEADRPYRGEEGVNQSREEFLKMMTSLEFLPNSPTLMNAGRELGQLSACFVLPVEDSMEGIFEAVKNMALIHKSGGGTGFSFSRLRPKNDVVMSTKGIASGPVSFMTVFDAATETVKQGGTRRGANMGVLQVDHPDIIEFIHSKEEHKRLNNFNISVALTKPFMEALSSESTYELVNPRTGAVVEKLSALEVFREIAEMAWKSGEPGVIFLDRINEMHPLKALGEIESTNPCGEQPLLPYESCNLGSINLGLMVRTNNGAPQVDWGRLESVVREAVHFLDNVIDKSKFPLPQIEKVTKAHRKIGLGVMGFADMLIKLGVAYDSEEALRWARDVMSFVSRISREASQALAAERGPFPEFHKSTYAEEGMAPLRNATTTTIAPTGTLSIIAHCSSGIEPIFAVAYEKRVLDGEKLMEIHPEFLRVMKDYGLAEEGLIKRIAEEGCIGDIAEIPEDIKRIFVSAHEVLPEWHLRMQAAFQEFTDNAVSKTVNLPESAEVDDVENLYRQAYELGLKGVTIYRYGSRPSQVLYRGYEARGIKPRERSKVTWGTTEKVRIGCGNLYITVNSDDEGICEVFTALGRAGGCPSQSEATSRLISLGLRSGIDIGEIVEQLKGIRCLSSIKSREAEVLSCPDAIARAIEKYLRNEGMSGMEPSNGDAVGKCPECGAKLESAGGCFVCGSCGFSRCGPD